MLTLLLEYKVMRLKLSCEDYIPKIQAQIGSNLISLYVVQNALLIGSKLDDSSSGQSCRLAMHGRIVSTLNPSDPNKQQTLQVFKLKSKIGAIERNLPDGKTAICKGFFKKESDFTAFIGMKVIYCHQFLNINNPIL